MKTLSARLTLILALCSLAVVGWQWTGRQTARADNPPGPAASTAASPVATPAATSQPASRPEVPTTGPAAGLARAHVFVSGHVQAVGFRAFTSDRARTFKIKGWVTNLADGRVELVAEGRPDALDKFLAEVRKGPATGHVDGMDVTYEPPTGLFVRYEAK